MAQLTYEGLAKSTLACELGFQQRNIESKEQLQNFYNQMSRNNSAVGHILGLDGEQIMLMNNEEPVGEATVEQHLIEDLQRELENQLKREPSISGVKRQQRMINKYANILEAIQALPETNGEKQIEELSISSVHD